MKAGVSFVGLIATFMGAPVAAQSYDFAADFGNAVFSYGYGYKSADGSVFTSFTPFDPANSYASGCAGVAAFACITSGGDTLTPQSLPAVGINTSNAPIYPYTLSLYPGELFLHPGADPAQSVIVQFTAPRTGDYKINAYLYRIDDSGLSNGANLTTAHNGVVVQSGSLGAVSLTRTALPTMHAGRAREVANLRRAATLLGRQSVVPCKSGDRRDGVRG